MKLSDTLASYLRFQCDRVKFLDDIGSLLNGFARSPRGADFEFHQDGEAHISNRNATVMFSVRERAGNGEYLDVSLDQSSIVGVELNEERETLDFLEIGDPENVGLRVLVHIFSTDLDSKLAAALRDYVDEEVGFTPATSAKMDFPGNEPR